MFINFHRVIYSIDTKYIFGFVETNKLLLMKVQHLDTNSNFHALTTDSQVPVQRVVHTVT
jgi:hypothetical protein